MSQADRIKQHVLDHYVKPARASNDITVTVRVGDVHEQMRLKQGQPAVSAALGSNKFEAIAHVERACVMGPLNGSNCVFVFRLL